MEEKESLGERTESFFIQASFKRKGRWFFVVWRNNIFAG